MPTLSTHVDDATVKAVADAAKISAEKRPGPWIGEAVRQRLERDGMLPGSPTAELLALAEEVGLPAAVEALRSTLRTSTPAA